MAKKSLERIDVQSESTAHALTGLVNQIQDSLEAGGLQARFAEKLGHRIRKEANELGLMDSQVPEGLTLALKLDTLDNTVTQHRADGLIAAMAKLRLSDDRASV